MYDILSGVRVVEMGSFVFVPLAAAVLADWGAEVIKVEPPKTGDPYRGLVTAGMPASIAGVDLSFQYANRGKRSIGLDLTQPRGRELLAELIAQADVFMTNLRPAIRARLGIEVDDIRAMNPNCIVVRGSGYGQHGPMTETAGLDGTAYWARGGVGGALTPPGSERPLSQRPAFGDVVSAMTLAGGVAGALYKKAATGKAGVVDVGLLNVGMWQVQRDILSAQFNLPTTQTHVPRGERNPMTDTYKTQDGRFFSLSIVNPDPYWTEFCNLIGKPELITDERFATMDVRNQNAKECVAILDEMFASRPLAHWIQLFTPFSGAWAPVQMPADLHHDEQALANGWFTEITAGDDVKFNVVSSPVTFDEFEGPRQMPGAPELGQHTEEILLELGYSWDDILPLKDAGVIN
jgi:crotonobetainyl-CoA:carnitine CoA-transferase CaiB-like acyl-CoA transferase